MPPAGSEPGAPRHRTGSVPTRLTPPQLTHGEHAVGRALGLNHKLALAATTPRGHPVPGPLVRPRAPFSPRMGRRAGDEGGRRRAGDEGT